MAYDIHQLLEAMIENGASDLHLHVGRAPSLRDDPVAVHPLVREVSALFDATIVRIEAAGTLSPSDAAAAAGTDAAEAAEPGHHGDDDV